MSLTFTPAFSPISLHEIVTLVAIAENIDHPTDGVSTFILRQDTERAGFTKVATMLALTGLLQKNFISTNTSTDYDGTEFTINELTDTGMQWLMANQDKLVLRREPPPPSAEPEIPF